MTDDGSTRLAGRIATGASAAVRLAVDLVVITLWTAFLTLLFLETAWPRWGFYALLVGGVAIYVTVTAAWIRVDDA
ncbi:hypothetical protein [Halopiger djelfimassiliensis]|uniref:hypothetical protein n=1 Tax=Halopiger djelfimassiliensis TaxID=1293047 RepID=UPI000677ECEC|nr:hypothetical protein [Halopiger djelfimassiliensis]